MRSTSHAYAKKVASRALRFRTGADVRRYLEQIFRKEFPEISETEMMT